MSKQLMINGVPYDKTQAEESKFKVTYKGSTQTMTASELRANYYGHNRSLVGYSLQLAVGESRSSTVQGERMTIKRIS